MLISASADGTALVWDATATLPPRHLKPVELNACWSDLSKDAAKAFDAIRLFSAAPEQAMPFLAKQVQPTQAIAADRLAGLIKALGTDSLEQRTKAAAELENLGDLAEEALKKATAANLPLEHNGRIRHLLDKLPAPLSTDQQREIRAVEVLERIGNPEARNALASLAKGAANARLTMDAQAALDRLAKSAKSP